MLIICDPIYADHLTGQGHPESPQRYHSVVQALIDVHLKTEDNTLLPRAATKQELLLCHTEEYCQIVQRDVFAAKELELFEGNFTLSTGDVQLSPASWQVALKAVGAGLTAVDAIMQGKTKRAFCVVRPPGHHATSSAGMGFCLFNNVAIAARYAQSKYGIGKVLIVDWDVHHGNGTQEIFEEDPSVFYFSTHQEFLYPGTGKREEIGKGLGTGTILNIPIAAGERSRIEVIEAFSGSLVEAMHTFKPEFVFISAGFDAHWQDPLGGFNLEDEDFALLTDIVSAIAEHYAHGRVVSLLEGGYHLEALARASVVHVAALA